MPWYPGPARLGYRSTPAEAVMTSKDQLESIEEGARMEFEREPRHCPECLHLLNFIGTRDSGFCPECGKEVRYHTG